MVDRLGGPEVAGYRAWWYYQAGTAAYLDETSTGADRASDFFIRAARASSSIPWLASLAHRLEVEEVVAADDQVALTAQGVREAFEDLGWSGAKFEREMTKLRELLGSTDSKEFETGLQQLGKFLGFESISPVGQATPDALWRAGDDLILVFEARAKKIHSIHCQ